MEFKFPAEWGETHTDGDDQTRQWWGVSTYQTVVRSSMEVS